MSTRDVYILKEHVHTGERKVFLVTRWPLRETVRSQVRLLRRESQRSDQLEDEYHVSDNEVTFSTAK